MKKWISLMTAAACALSSVRADDVAYEEETPAPIMGEIIQEGIDEPIPPKQVGKVSVEGAQAARTSTAGKYILAASAVAIGVAALILVSRHHGHH